MNKVFILGLLWVSHTFGESFNLSDVDVTTYQVFNGFDSSVPQATAKPLCMSIMCNQRASIGVDPQDEVPTITPIIENTAFETLGEAIFTLGQWGLADNCRHSVAIPRDKVSACEW